MGDPTRIPAATFGVGFALLWQARPEQAQKYMLDALAMAERTGDPSLVARCVTYLAIVYRQLGQVEQTRQFIVHSLEAARVAHMPEYTALAEANAAWVAWRSNDGSGVHEHGQAALTLWKELPPGHASAPFQWTARCPLMAAGLRDDEIDQAIDHAKALLDPNMQRLPDALTTALEQAVQAWELGQRQEARALLDQSLSLSRQFRLL
jgi:eukaryotic-like serine/threonine-protein kinase